MNFSRCFIKTLTCQSAIKFVSIFFLSFLPQVFVYYFHFSSYTATILCSWKSIFFVEGEKSSWRSKLINENFICRCIWNVFNVLYGFFRNETLRDISFHTFIKFIALSFLFIHFVFMWFIYFICVWMCHYEQLYCYGRAWMDAIALYCKMNFGRWATYCNILWVKVYQSRH